MATYAAFKHVELHKIGYGKNRVPNAPRGRISEIFNGDEADGRAANGNGVARSVRAPRSPRETPVRPRDTHSRLFGQGGGPPPAPLVTDNVRSNIRFGDAPDAPHANGSRGSSPAKSPLLNGAASVSPSRESADASPLARRDPVTGRGVSVPPPCRRWAAARSRGAAPVPWPPAHPPYRPRHLPAHTVDPYTLIGLHEPPALHKYESRDAGAVPDYALLQTPLVPGPHTLACHPPVLTRHAPGYLFGGGDRNDRTRAHFLNYAHARQIEGNPITGDGYKSLNGEINMAVTALNGNHMPIHHNRIPPGGYSSGLW